MRKIKKTFEDKRYEACLIEVNKADARLSSIVGPSKILRKFLEQQLEIAKANLERARKARYNK